MVLTQDLDPLRPRIAFTPDNGWVLTTHKTGRIRAWPLRWEELTLQAQLTVGRNLTRGEWDRYFPDDRWKDLLGTSGYQRVFSERPIPRREKPVRVFFERLPTVEGGNAKQLFLVAAEAWEAVCGVQFAVTDDRRDANLIVTTVKLDGAGVGKLEESDMGPPRNVPLSIRFDEEENFSVLPESGSPNPGQVVFVSAACHAVGHALGLTHRLPNGEMSGPGTVMYMLHQPGVTAPVPLDAERAQKIWGLPSRVVR